MKSGEVPSQERETALQALQTRPVETFDFHNEDAVTARWAMANFALLGPRLTAELAEQTHAGFRPVAWWVELLFRYSSAPVDQTTRNSSLFETVFSGDLVETDVHEKLITLLNLTGLVTSPVLILDEVEGFSSNPEAALQVATFLNALHQSCEKLALIISVNGDVWETAFLPRIPCGLKDRLSDIVVDLKPMDKEVAMTMLKDRAGDKAEDVAKELDFESGVVYARGVIRCAANAWTDVSDGDEASVENHVVPAPEPISLAEQESDYDEDPVVATPHADLQPPAVVIPDESAAVSSPEPVTLSAEPADDDQVESPVAAMQEDQQSDDHLHPLEPEMPDLSNLPQPFAQQQTEPETIEPAQGTSPEPSPFTPVEDHSSVSEQPPAYNPQVSVPPQQAPPSQAPEPTPPTEPLEVPPQNVINSPFTIDTSVACSVTFPACWFTATAGSSCRSSASSTASSRESVSAG